QVMTSLAELFTAADAFTAAVLAAPPAPGISAGVPDYANVLPPPRQTAAPRTKSSTKSSDESGKEGGRSAGVRFADLVSISGTAAGVTAVTPSRPLPMRAAVTAAAGRWFRQYRMLVW
ncbi:hypothetical protein Vafri_12852, partial [Volvox africanus]